MNLSSRCRPLRSVPQRGSCCAHLGPDHPIQRPDLAIYSQVEQIAGGIQPSWDSPDILSNSWGPFRLNPEAEVQVRNLSSIASAANALVNFSTAAFGIGFPRTLVATKKITLAPSQQVMLKFPLEQAILSGDQRVGVFIDLEHPYDAKAINNHGEQVHEGAFTSESGRDFHWVVPLFNNSYASTAFVLQVIEDSLSATVSQSSITLAPFAGSHATLHIKVPGGVHGTPANPAYCSATLLAKHADGSLIGGATRLVRIDD
ncbi:MAG: hypothetical protein JWR16_1480 [Nevskia sp.]|nr:hypothetical protein [Nevskia sp.]